jgi:hypothetical protein
MKTNTPSVWTSEKNHCIKKSFFERRKKLCMRHLADYKRTDEKETKKVLTPT